MNEQSTSPTIPLSATLEYIGAMAAELATMAREVGFLPLAAKLDEAADRARQMMKAAASG